MFGTPFTGQRRQRLQHRLIALAVEGMTRLRRPAVLLTLAAVGLAWALLAAPLAGAAPAATAHTVAGSGGAGITTLAQDAGFGATGGGYNGTAAQINAGGYGWTSAQYWRFGTTYGTTQRHNCTTYAAYRLQHNGYQFPGWCANADGWDNSAWAASPRVNVDQTPGVGAIAQWNLQHVAYVDQVLPDGIVTTSDSYGGGTDRLKILNTSPSWPDNFIHFKDIPQTRPAQPLNPRVTGTGSYSATLAWADASNNETDFRVQYRIGTGAWVAASATAAANAQSLTVTGLAPSTTYTFQVGAHNAIGTKWSVYFNGTTKPPLPAQPLNPRVTATTQTAASLTWADASNNETNFRVQYRIGTGAWQQASPWSGPNVTGCTVTGLAPGTAYTFQVGARNTAGTKWSEYCYGTTKPTLPAQPLSPRVTGTGYYSANLAWADASNNEADFKVQYRVGTGAWVTAGVTAAANAAGCTVGGLAPNTSYTFQVGARNVTGTHWSVYFYGKTLALPTLPAQPLSPRVTATGSYSATLAWADASNNEADFIVQYRVGAGAWVLASASAGANAQSLTIGGLAASTAYTFQVGARNITGTHWSAYCYGTTQAPPPSAYAGHIVQWAGDTKTQKTAWYVTNDLRRLWIPDAATYYALKGQGAPGPDVLPAGTLNQLPDQNGLWAAAGSSMAVNRTLRRGMYLRSGDKRYLFVLQGDGNLVLYGPSGRALWANSRFDTGFAVFQGDGNFVCYRDAGGANWAAGVGGRGGAYLVVQNDGNVVIYTSGGAAVWATNTAGRL